MSHRSLQSPTWLLAAALLVVVSSRAPGQTPALPGQAAYGALGELVRILKADPATDWSKVNLEGVRQHFIDMDEVTMHAEVVQRRVPGGIAAEVTGTGKTVAAIRRMLPLHSRVLDASADLRSATEDMPSGIRITTTARQLSDSALVVRIRGLGFVGLFTDGDHHARHHIALARGDAMAHGRD